MSRPYWTPLERWLGDDSESFDEASGYAELVRRWLWSFGPGTEADLVWWLGATKGAARRALADVGAVGCRLEDGSPAWLQPDDATPVPPPGDWAALLPALDPTTMGWRQRRFYLGDHAARIVDSRGNGGPTAWWNGRVVGSWTQAADGDVIVAAAEDLPGSARQLLGHRANELTAWLGGEIVNTVYPAPLVRTTLRGGQ